MTLPPGYRFFRDDELLNRRAKETRYCNRCNELYWIDELNDNPFGDGYCKKCIDLFYSRTNLLSKRNRPRAGCPTDSKEYIFTDKYHNCSGRGKYQATHESYKYSEKLYDELEHDRNLKSLKDYWKIKIPKSIKELKKKKEILKANYILRKN